MANNHYLLSQALAEYGSLAAVMQNLDATLASWAKSSSLPRINSCQRKLGLEFDDAFANGIRSPESKTPLFLYRMCFIHTYGVYEQYLNSLVGRIIHAKPRILLAAGEAEDRKLDYKQLVDVLESKADLIDQLIDRETARCMRQSMKEILKTLRERYGLSRLTKEHDSRLSQLALMRNCVVHGAGIANEQLATASKQFYQNGSEIRIDRNVVSRSITLFGSFIIELETTATLAHFK